MRRISLALLALLLPPAGAGAQDFSRQLAEELNLARTQPRAYADIVAATASASRRDPKAAGEAVRFLRKARPLAPLGWAAPLAASARDHVASQGAEGSTGHKSRAGGPQRRIERHARWSGMIGEAVHYGRTTPRGVVVSWIVDAGVRGRGHRKVVFHPRLRLVGAAHGGHARYGRMTVADFAAAVGKSEGVFASP